MTVYKIKKSNQDNKEKIENISKNTKGLNAKKYCGKIKIKEDPIKYQKDLRDEWE